MTQDGRAYLLRIELRIAHLWADTLIRESIDEAAAAATAGLPEGRGRIAPPDPAAPFGTANLLHAWRTVLWLQGAFRAAQPPRAAKNWPAYRTGRPA